MSIFVSCSFCFANASQDLICGSIVFSESRSTGVCSSEQLGAMRICSFLNFDCAYLIFWCCSLMFAFQMFLPLTSPSERWKCLGSWSTTFFHCGSVVVSMCMPCTGSVVIVFRFWSMPEKYVASSILSFGACCVSCV